MPIFRVKSVKIYTGQKNFTRICSWGLWQIWGMHKLQRINCVFSFLFYSLSFLNCWTGNYCYLLHMVQMTKLWYVILEAAEYVSPDSKQELSEWIILLLEVRRWRRLLSRSINWHKLWSGRNACLYLEMSFFNFRFRRLKYVIPFQDCMYKTNKYEDRWNQNEGRNYFELDKPSI